MLESMKKHGQRRRSSKHAFGHRTSDQNENDAVVGEDTHAQQMERERMFQSQESAGSTALNGKDAALHQDKVYNEKDQQVKVSMLHDAQKMIQNALNQLTNMNSGQ